jgi:hypothetical protein
MNLPTLIHSNGVAGKKTTTQELGYENHRDPCMHTLVLAGFAIAVLRRFKLQ